MFDDIYSLFKDLSSYTSTKEITSNITKDSVKESVSTKDIVAKKNAAQNQRSNKATDSRIEEKKESKQKISKNKKVKKTAIDKLFENRFAWRPKLINNFLLFCDNQMTKEELYRKHKRIFVMEDLLISDEMKKQFEKRLCYYIRDYGSIKEFVKKEKRGKYLITSKEVSSHIPFFIDEPEYCTTCDLASYLSYLSDKTGYNTLYETYPYRPDDVEPLNICTKQTILDLLEYYKEKIGFEELYRKHRDFFSYWTFCDKNAFKSILISINNITYNNVSIDKIVYYLNNPLFFRKRKQPKAVPLNNRTQAYDDDYTEDKDSVSDWYYRLKTWDYYTNGEVKKAIDNNEYYKFENPDIYFGIPRSLRK